MGWTQPSLFQNGLCMGQDGKSTITPNLIIFSALQSQARGTVTKRSRNSLILMELKGRTADALNAITLDIAAIKSD
jgi:hypothetical protein